MEETVPAPGHALLRAELEISETPGIRPDVPPYDQLMRILVAEDERGIAEFLQRALEFEGFSVRCAADGEAARLWR